MEYVIPGVVVFIVAVVCIFILLFRRISEKTKKSSPTSASLAVKPPPSSRCLTQRIDGNRIPRSGDILVSINAPEFKILSSGVVIGDQSTLPMKYPIDSVDLTITPASADLVATYTSVSPKDLKNLPSTNIPHITC